jgi:hypothetical protein
MTFEDWVKTLTPFAFMQGTFFGTLAQAWQTGYDAGYKKAEEDHDWNST